MSTPIIARVDFQQLADVRLREAKALLDLGMWDGAYYLAGYAVELALKACIIKAVMTTDAFPEKRFSENCWTHDLGRLIELAGLKSAWTLATASSPDLRDNWAIAKDWSEQTRYFQITDAEAKGLYDAVSEPKHGVLPWIKIHW